MDHEFDHAVHEGSDHEHASQEAQELMTAFEQPDNAVCYHQSCPVCGRNLRIRVMLLGQRVYCQHCGGGFIATDACNDTPAPHAADDRPRSVIVDELIERAAVMLGLTPGQDAAEPNVMGHRAE